MSLATTKSKLAGVPQDRHLVIPLGPPVGRFTLLPIGGGSGNRRLGQPDDKPHVSMAYHIPRPPTGQQSLCTNMLSMPLGSRSHFIMKQASRILLASITVCIP